MLGVDPRPEVLAHELAHSFGELNDEYSYVSDFGQCNPDGINVSGSDPPSWVCLAEGFGGALCPDGRAVDHHPLHPSCPQGAPCQACMMSVAGGDFCPVCDAQMDAALADTLGSPLSEDCNGADDDVGLAQAVERAE